jgi:mannose-6-phosphate isomerase-like protein (cupin superfamily)
MKREDLTFQNGFRVSVGNDRSQGAVMVLGKGGCEGGPDNRHRGADQWLVVISGTGATIINGHRITLRTGSMVLIERGDTHEIRNIGRACSKP